MCLSILRVKIERPLLDNFPRVRALVFLAPEIVCLPPGPEGAHLVWGGLYFPQLRGGLVQYAARHVGQFQPVPIGRGTSAHVCQRFKEFIDSAPGVQISGLSRFLDWLFFIELIS
jgi:hypothetical protein